MSNYIDPIFKKTFPYFNYFRRSERRRLSDSFTYKEYHHGWLGVGMITAGLIIDFISIWTGNLVWLGMGLIIGGVWNYIDDRLQHTKQGKEIEDHGYYQSMTFLHWAFSWVYPLWNRIRSIK